MPSIADAIQKNIQRQQQVQASGAEDGLVTPVPNEAVVPDVPALPNVVTSGLPVRGVYTPDKILHSDFSPNTTGMRTSGSPMRSPTFPPQQVGTTTTTKVTNNTSISTSASITVKVNNIAQNVTNLINLIQGSGVTITSDGQGNIIINGTSSGGDGLTHGDSVWEYDSAYIIYRDDFLFGTPTISASSPGGGNTLGDLRWDALGASLGVNTWRWSGAPPYIGQVMFNTTTNASTPSASNAVMSMFTPGGVDQTANQPGATFKGTQPLFDYPGWKMTWVFGFPVNRFTSAPSLFPLTKVAFYCGLTTVQDTATQAGWSPNSASNRPPYFVGLRLDTDPGVSYALTSAGNAASGLTTYNGTITNGASNFFQGDKFTITGFVANPGNNGTFVCAQSTASTLVLINAGGVSETHAGTAVQVAISDSTFKFETVANFNSMAGSTTAGFRNNTPGTVIDTGMSPSETTSYRFEIACNAVGSGTMTLTDSNKNQFTHTFTAPQVTVQSNASNGIQTLLLRGNGLGAIGVSSAYAGGANITNTFTMAVGTKITITNAAQAFYNGTFTIAGTESNSYYTFVLAGGSNTDTDSTATIVFYPGVTPYFSWGNDTQSSPASKTIAIDYWSFVWNPNLGPSAPGSPNSKLPRYF